MLARVVAGLLAGLALSSPASAATVSAKTTPGAPHRLTVMYESAGHSAERVRAVFSGRGLTLRVTGSPVLVGDGCTRRRDGSIRCAGPDVTAAWLRVAAGAGDDRILISRRRSIVTRGVRVDAGAGDDTVVLREPEFVLGWVSGGLGNDRLTGPAQLYGGPGSDTLTGRSRMFGGGGSDVLHGTDTHLDGDGPDRPGGRPAVPARDWIEGHGIRDTADYSRRRTPVTVDLARGVGPERDTLRGIDEVYGGHGDDMLIGGTGHDTLYGFDGRDRLTGGAGNDILDGGTKLESDVVTGGAGDDRLTAIGPGSSCGTGRDIVNAQPEPRTALPLDCENFAFGAYWTDQHGLQPHDGALRGRTVTIPVVASSAVLYAGWGRGGELARGTFLQPDGPMRFRLTAREAARLTRTGGRVTLSVEVWECCEDDAEYRVTYRVPLRLRYAGGPRVAASGPKRST
jgi:hypothetical protein